MCKLAVLRWKPKTWCVLYKLYNVVLFRVLFLSLPVHEAIEWHVLLTEATKLHTSFLGATSFHMHQQYAYCLPWHGQLHVHTCIAIHVATVITA